jgi:hypothetical protein
MPRLMPRLLLTVVFVLIGSVLCSAQETGVSTAASSTTSASNQQDSDILKLLEITKIQLEGEKEKGKLKDQQLAAKDTQLEAFKGLVAVRDEQIALLRSANQDRAAVNTGDARMLQACEQQLARSDAEIARLRNPGFFKSIFNTDTLFKVGLGYGLGQLNK